MPIYEYRCEACGAERELILKPGEQAKPSCPKCRRRMARVISPTAFILKGSGWYVTDYPSEARKKGVDAERPAPKGKEKEGGAAPAAKEAAAAPAEKKAGHARKPRGKRGA